MNGLKVPIRLLPTGPPGRDATPVWIDYLSWHFNELRMHISKIVYRKTGGFMGVLKGCDLTLGDLPDNDRVALESLLEGSSLLKLTSKTQPHAKDVFYYHLTFTTDDGKEHDLKFDDVTLPVSVRPLVRYLEAKSADMKR